MIIGVEQPAVRALFHRLLTAALQAVDPALAIHHSVTRRGFHLKVGPRRYDLRQYKRLIAVGAGKASAPMAAALEERLGNRLTGGLVVVKYGHGCATRTIEVVEAGHPVPDQAGQRAVQQVLGLAAGLSRHDLLFVLLSGGASSLLPAPVPGLTLADKQETTQLLLKSGAGIQEINTVRKHLSSIKGGRLAAATRATVISLVLSDVIGDDLGTIASGPTAPDPTTYADAIRILRRYGIWDVAPLGVRQHLLQGRRGLHAESPKPAARLFRRVHNHVIGNNQAAVDAVAREATRAGLRPLVLSTSLTGEAREAARVLGGIAREIATTGRPIRPPACVIAGGELTVSIRGNGTGGRAQEFALAIAPEIAGLPDVWVAAFGTDGTDGPTDAAGAVVDGRTVARAEALGLRPLDFLMQNDAYPFFKRLEQLIVSGPTGTNVNDLYLLLVR
ncbi:MAG TPA: glycerate kinase [Nitrospiraceae bacterium]|nr:glycerate kinase [Nitrospiraceae bacterium]